MRDIPKGELKTHGRAPLSISAPGGGGVHRYGPAITMDLDCWWRQFSATKIRRGDELNPTPNLIREFANFLDSGEAYRRPKRGHEHEPPTDQDHLYF